jgi:hypothetical protein
MDLLGPGGHRWPRDGEGGQAPLRGGAAIGQGGGRRGLDRSQEALGGRIGGGRGHGLGSKGGHDEGKHNDVDGATSAKFQQ